MDDLTGTADDRVLQLSQLDAATLSPEWLRRQLDLALAAWGDDETILDIEAERRGDF
jgi:hypothetical protein